MPATNPVEFILVNLTKSNPNRIGREKNSLNCLPVDVAQMGAERCAPEHCVDPSTKSCILMSTSTYFARRSSDHGCVNLNEAVGVDDCAAGSYCIDHESNPTRCVDLNE